MIICSSLCPTAEPGAEAAPQPHNDRQLRATGERVHHGGSGQATAGCKDALQQLVAAHKVPEKIPESEERVELLSSS